VSEEPPRGQRHASESEIQDTEHELGSYSYSEVQTRSHWRIPWRHAVPVFDVTDVRLAGGEGHEHISELRWRTPANQTGTDTLTNMIGRIRDGADVRVVRLGRVVKVGVVHADPPYIRAYVERYEIVTGIRGYIGKLGWSTRVRLEWTDDLLTLPRF
jgi:hypothetical protein